MNGKMAYAWDDKNRKVLLAACRCRMPFGKYKGSMLLDLPDGYVEALGRKGFPKGTLGVLLETVYEIKLNGLESLVRPLLS